MPISFTAVKALAVDHSRVGVAVGFSGSIGAKARRIANANGLPKRQCAAKSCETRPAHRIPPRENRAARAEVPLLTADGSYLGRLRQSCRVAFGLQKKSLLTYI